MTENAADSGARPVGDAQDTECSPPASGRESPLTPSVPLEATAEAAGHGEPGAQAPAAAEAAGPVVATSGREATTEPPNHGEPDAAVPGTTEVAGQEESVADPRLEGGPIGPSDEGRMAAHGAPALDAASQGGTEGLAEPFRSFFAHYGPTLCGRPLGEVVIEEGRRRQYFECLALEEHEPGRLRLVRLGEAWLAIRQGQKAVRSERSSAFVDVSRSLRRDPAQHYNMRPLCDIRYLVIHHTGAPAAFGPEAIATSHVEDNGWPGIGYHFVIDFTGTVYRTQDLTVVSYHARQFNPASVGIALMGDLTSAQPTPAQLAATADLIAGLLFDLGLPLDAVRGHREMVPTPCPGDPFLRVWRPRLIAAIQERIDARQVERVSQIVAGPSPEP